jgi:hypothetical protein
MAVLLDTCHCLVQGNARYAIQTVPAETDAEQMAGFEQR